MSFLNLSLRKRLLLAAVPTITYIFLNRIYCLVDGAACTEPYGIWVWWAWAAYAGLFGAFVLAPFIMAKSNVVLRTVILVLASIVIPSAWILVEEWADWSLDAGIYFLMLGIVATTVLLSVILVVTAPLRVSWKYWLFVALVGVLSSFIVFYGFVESLCFWGPCVWWKGYVPVVSVLVWQLLFCTAIHFGRSNGTLGDQIRKRSEVE